MNKENTILPGYVAPTRRITRARAASLLALGEVLPSKPLLPKPDKQQIQRGKSKRDENNYAAPTAASQYKKRAVLVDKTDIWCENSFKDCMNATKIQAKLSKRSKSGPSTKAKLSSDKKISSLAPAISVEGALVLKNKKDEQMQEVVTLEAPETALPFNVKENLSAPQNTESLMDGRSTCGMALSEEYIFNEQSEFIRHSKHAKDDFCKDSGGSSDLDIIDIDSEHKNPLMCCLYSSDIYSNLHAAELLHRPCSNFMETVQRDITHSMRGILIDWLVENFSLCSERQTDAVENLPLLKIEEFPCAPLHVLLNLQQNKQVSDEYKLDPDTLFLTVNIIDRFLSHNYIERQRLQLLGITSMLIASKYEEICSPTVEEFCFITDNAYTKGEVLKMEIQILRDLGFQLCVPTITTFLRRFLRAAHTSYKVPPQGLSHLANYLAELTLVDYSFLKFLPSIIAASAVFLARWTLEQSDHPWNHTLEHYTSYKASELKVAIHAMQELQMNSKNCPLNAIRGKYQQSKFESVSGMTSPKLLQSLFY